MFTRVRMHARGGAAGSWKMRSAFQHSQRLWESLCMLWHEEFAQVVKSDAHWSFQVHNMLICAAHV